MPCCNNVCLLVLIVWLESPLLARLSNNLLSSCHLLRCRSEEQAEICAQVGPVCCGAEGSPLLQKHWGGAGRSVEEPGSGWGWRWQNRGWMWPLPAASRPAGRGWLESAAYWERELKTGRAGTQSGRTGLCSTGFKDNKRFYRFSAYQ